MQRGLALGTNIERCLQFRIFRTFDIATESPRHRSISGWRSRCHDSCIRVSVRCRPRLPQHRLTTPIDCSLASVREHLCRPLLGRSLMTRNPRRFLLIQRLRVYSPCKKAFLLIADLQKSKRSKTLACAFPNNVVAYKLDAPHMFKFHETN
jgi:hypothetical protein